MKKYFDYKQWSFIHKLTKQQYRVDNLSSDISAVIFYLRGPYIIVKVWNGTPHTSNKYKIDSLWHSGSIELTDELRLLLNKIWTRYHQELKLNSIK